MWYCYICIKPLKSIQCFPSQIQMFSVVCYLWRLCHYCMDNWLLDIDSQLSIECLLAWGMDKVVATCLPYMSLKFLVISSVLFIILYCFVCLNGKMKWLIAVPTNFQWFQLCCHMLLINNDIELHVGVVRSTSVLEGSLQALAYVKWLFQASDFSIID